MPCKEAPCVVEGCDRTVKSKGYCSSHYDRIIKIGSPMAWVPLNKNNHAKGFRLPNHRLIAVMQERQRSVHSVFDRYSTDPLIRRYGAYLRTALSRPDSTVSDEMADRIAKRLGLMPWDIWPEYEDLYNPVYIEIQNAHLAKQGVLL